MKYITIDMGVNFVKINMKTVRQLLPASSQLFFYSINLIIYHNCLCQKWKR